LDHLPPALFSQGITGELETMFSGEPNRSKINRLQTIKNVAYQITVHRDGFLEH